MAAIRPGGVVVLPQELKAAALLTVVAATVRVVLAIAPLGLSQKGEWGAQTLFGLAPLRATPIGALLLRAGLKVQRRDFT